MTHPEEKDGQLTLGFGVPETDEAPQEPESSALPEDCAPLPDQLSFELGEDVKIYPPAAKPPQRPAPETPPIDHFWQFLWAGKSFFLPVLGLILVLVWVVSRFLAIPRGLFMAAIAGVYLGSLFWEYTRIKRQEPVMTPNADAAPPEQEAAAPVILSPLWEDVHTETLSTADFPLPEKDTAPESAAMAKVAEEMIAQLVQQDVAKPVITEEEPPTEEEAKSPIA